MGRLTDVEQRVDALEQVVQMHHEYVWGIAAPEHQPEWLKEWAERIGGTDGVDGKRDRHRVGEGTRSTEPPKRASVGLASDGIEADSADAGGHSERTEAQEVVAPDSAKERWIEGWKTPDDTAINHLCWAWSLTKEQTVKAHDAIRDLLVSLREETDARDSADAEDAEVEEAPESPVKAGAAGVVDSQPEQRAIPDVGAAGQADSVGDVVTDTARLSPFAEMVRKELVAAREGNAPQNSLHEAYAVILEEVDEFWDEVKKKASKRVDSEILTELVQIAAMCQRAAEDVLGAAIKAEVVEEDYDCDKCRDVGIIAKNGEGHLCPDCLGKDDAFVDERNGHLHRGQYECRGLLR